MYRKPEILMTEELAEGVYAASGAVAGAAGSANCWKGSGEVTMQPQEFVQDYYTVQIHGQHFNSESHVDASGQTITVTFNQAVSFVSCRSAQLSGSGSGTSLTLTMSVRNNANQHIDFNDLNVRSAAGLQVAGVTISDGY